MWSDLKRDKKCLKANIGKGHRRLELKNFIQLSFKNMMKMMIMARDLIDILCECDTKRTKLPEGMRPLWSLGLDKKTDNIKDKNQR